MKKLIIILTLIFAIPVIGLAYREEPPPEEPKPPETWCPATRITDNDKCLNCHVMMNKDGKIVFGLKEAEPEAHRRLPLHTKVYGNTAVYKLVTVNSDPFMEFRDYVFSHPELKQVTIEVDSFGGSVFEAWRIKGLMDDFKRRGYTVRTECRGVAMSAGFLLFVSGTFGARYAGENAELMWHELWGVDWPKITTPASKEEEAKRLRHWQDNLNNWIASRSKGRMTKEEVDEQLKFKEMWFTGKEAVEAGFVDGLLTDF